jgi:hypothetical protein
MTILKKLLEERGIHPIEAGGSLAPGQNAFCAKICSKIIASQFCIVLINNEEADGKEIPNANVNMEYGLMLGFNKYVIPFQREAQQLPFNVAGLDTIKYQNRNFEELAINAIDQAIEITGQDTPQLSSPNQNLETFLLTKRALVTPLNSDGDKNLFQMGSPLGFNLLNDFAGLDYIYLGNFTAHRPEVVLWRLAMLRDILDGRRSSLDMRVKVGIVPQERLQVLKDLLDRLQIWIVLTSKEDKLAVEKVLDKSPLPYKTQVFSLDDIQSELAKLAMKSA